MNNIADLIPSLILASAGIGFVVALALASFELLGSRRSDRGYQPLRQAPLPRRTGLVLVQHQEPAAASANAAEIKAAA